MPREDRTAGLLGPRDRCIGHLAAFVAQRLRLHAGPDPAQLIRRTVVPARMARGISATWSTTSSS